jgi:hypothetical protein
MTITAPAPTTINTGIVGRRVLTMVQMFDVARLTNHVTYIVGGAFVVVSGLGPKGDSNGSGKTSFQGACSVLLGDPLWNMRANHGKSAAGLLFESEAAGADGGAQSNAPHGYVVGVFSPRHDPDSASCITVWVRMATTAPYVRVRWTPGVLLADVDGYDARAVQADTIWGQLGTTRELSAHRYAEALYGDAPRCMSYLDTPLRPSGPSLLSQQMTSMTPAQIGESLIALSGMAPLLDGEQVERNKLAEAHEALARDVAEDRKVRANEDVELDAIRGRQEARQHLADGEHAWRMHWARGLLDADAAHREAEALMREVGERAATADARLPVARGTWEALRARRDLVDARDAAKREADQAHVRLKVFETATAEVSAELKGDQQRLNGLKGALDGWDAVSTPEQAEGETAAATAAKRVTLEALLAARTQQARAKGAHDLAVAGGSPETADVLAALEGAGIEATGLLDAVTLGEEARPFWEAALVPWSHAVVTADRDGAVRALAHLPGASIIGAGDTDTHPVGVTSTVPLGRFLTSLAARYAHVLDPARVHDDDLDVTIITGFAEPTTGRAARVHAAGRAVDIASETLRIAQGDDDLANGRVELANRRAEGARAARERDEIAVWITRRTEHLRQRQAQAVGLDTATDSLFDAYIEAKTLAANHGAAVAAAEDAFREAERNARELGAALESAQSQVEKACRRYWADGWGDTVEEAQSCLDEQPDGMRTLTGTRMRGRAIEALDKAVAAYTGRNFDDAPEDILQIREARNALYDDVDGTDVVPSFASTSRPLRDKLDMAAGRDEVNGGRIETDRQTRTLALETLTGEIEERRRTQVALQDMVENLVRDHFEHMKVAFDQLDITANGFGATLDVTTVRPSQPAVPWQFEVTPKWRRGPGKPYVSYQKVANGAQIKVHAVLIALAALKANPADVGGQMVIIDELGNSLGDMNRSDVLAALQTVAEAQHITIMGTCQDSVLKDAAAASKQVLWFTHASITDVLNRPVQMWGFDADSAHARLAAPYLDLGRPLA